MNFLQQSLCCISTKLCATYCYRIQHHRNLPSVCLFSTDNHRIRQCDGSHVTYQRLYAGQCFCHFINMICHGRSSARRQNDICAVIDRHKVSDALHTRFHFMNLTQYLCKFGHLSSSYESSFCIRFSTPVFFRIRTTTTPMAAPTIADGV